MVAYDAVKASNAKIAKTLSPGLVAVFVGGTSGIGEYALKKFAQHTVRPKIYFIGRSQEAGDRIAQELKALNKEGVYNFVKADTSLIRNVDEVCQDIKDKESSVNLLFLTQGTLDSTSSRSQQQDAGSVLTRRHRDQ